MLKKQTKIKKLCFVTTVSITLKSFVVETAKYLYNECGYDITLICDEDKAFAASLPEYIRYIPVKMSRGIDFSAFGSIKQLIKIFRKEKFDLVQYSTPNASFYASIAARFTKIPVRLYAQWGIRYVGLSGLSRKIFKALEKIVCINSTHIRAVSHGNKQFAVEEGLYKFEKAIVVGNGGTIGVDMQKYDVSKKADWRKAVRDTYGIAQTDFVFGFAGRLSRDKGSNELLTAFKNICEKYCNAKLLIVGPVEDGSGIDESLLNWSKTCENVIATGGVDNAKMCEYYSAMDLLVHPTYREGFGMVIQEAGALSVPTLTTRIIGASEVMEEGVSCALADPKDANDLENKMTELLVSPERVNELGGGAYERTKQLYDRPIMLGYQLENYKILLGEE